MTYQPGPYPTGYPSPYPNPYQYPQGYGYDPMQAALAPARRAGLLMIIMGFLMLACSMCCVGVLLLPADQIQQQFQAMEAQSGQATPLTVQQFRLGSMVIMAVLIGLGLPMIVIGVLVRRGGNGSIIAGIVLSVLLLILVGLYLVASLFRGGGVADLVVGACLMVLPAGLITLQLVWLVQAMRARSSVNAMQMQYQQQYWQYGQQQQQMYGQAGYAPPPGNPNVQASPSPPPQIPNSNDPPPPGGNGGPPAA